MYTTETHSDLLQQVQDDYVIKISEICTEQLKIIGTKNYLYLQSKLEVCDMHCLLFQEDRFDYASFHVILLVAHTGKYVWYNTSMCRGGVEAGREKNQNNKINMQELQ